MARARIRTKPEKVEEFPAEIQASLDKIAKIYGEGLTHRGDKLPRTNHISTGCFLIDFALLGGLPQGHVSMAYGYPSTGKTTFFLRAAGSFQRKHPGKWVAMIDSEGHYDPEWARALGVDTKRFIAVKPEYGEQGINILTEWLKNPAVGVVLLDSIPATVPMKVAENAPEDDTMAALARLMGKLCSKVTTIANAERRKGHWVSLWLVNQIRHKVGVVFGSPLHLPGGNQINHIPSTEIWLKLGKQVMAKDEFDLDVPDYNEQTFEMRKTKHGSSLKDGAFQLVLNPNHPTLGIGEYDNVHTLFDFGKRMGFVKGSGPEGSKAPWMCLSEKRGGKDFTRFKKQDDVLDWLYANEEERDTLARSLIARQRVSKGLPALPPDGFLWSKIGRLVENPGEVPAIDAEEEDEDEEELGEE